MNNRTNGKRKSEGIGEMRDGTGKTDGRVRATGLMDKGGREREGEGTKRERRGTKKGKQERDIERKREGRQKGKNQ